jgi:hypothetical protein
LVEHLKGFTNALTAPDVAALPSGDLDAVAIDRVVPVKRGAWWLVPKQITDAEGIDHA